MTLCVLILESESLNLDGSREKDTQTAEQRTLRPAYSCGITLEDNVDQDRTKFTYDWKTAAASSLAGGGTNVDKVRDVMG
jgi:hypothetical protein